MRGHRVLRGFPYFYPARLGKRLPVLGLLHYHSKVPGAPASSFVFWVGKGRKVGGGGEVKRRLESPSQKPSLPQ